MCQDCPEPWGIEVGMTWSLPLRSSQSMRTETGTCVTIEQTMPLMEDRKKSEGSGREAVSIFGCGT